MPRSNRPRRAGRPTPQDEPGGVRPLLGGQTYERGGDGEWHVRPVPGASALKEYRCPGCQQLIAPGTPHLLAWPSPALASLGTVALGEEGITARRHWHRACWQARTHRRPR